MMCFCCCFCLQITFYQKYFSEHQSGRDFVRGIMWDGLFPAMPIKYLFIYFEKKKKNHFHILLDRQIPGARNPVHGDAGCPGPGRTRGRRAYR